MVEDAFAVHGITNNRRKMLEIRMALTQEVRPLKDHLATGHNDKTMRNLRHTSASMAPALMFKNSEPWLPVDPLGTRPQQNTCMH